MAEGNMSIGVITLIAERFKVLSEPLRLQILQYLRTGEKSVRELTDVVQTSQPNVSKHLKILHSTGVLAREQRGNTVYYSIADESIFELCETVCGSLEENLKHQSEMFTA